MSKTIKQIADELGVSKQAVSKCIDNLGLRSTLTKNANYFVVGDKQEKVIKQAFLVHQTANQTPTKRQPNANQTPTTANQINDQTSDKSPANANQNANLSIDKGIDKSDLYIPMIEVLQATIDTLQGQLAAKDEQIRGQQAQIEQLTAALQQQTSALESTTAALTAAQALHAADKKALILMEDKEKQSNPFYSDENMERLQRSAEQMERTGEPVHSERKLSFWERRAAKKAEKKVRKENKNGKFGAN